MDLTLAIFPKLLLFNTVLLIANIYPHIYLLINTLMMVHWVNKLVDQILWNIA